MAEYMSNMEGQDVGRLMRLLRLLNEGNSVVRMLADHDVRQFTYVFNEDRIDVTLQLDRDGVHGR